MRNHGFVPRAFIATSIQRDGTAVTILENGPESFVLVVERGVAKRVRPISYHQAHLYRESRSEHVERDIAEMKAELARGLTG